MENIARYKMSFGNAVLYDDLIWFVAVEEPWLCKLDLNNYIAEKVCDLSEKKHTAFQYQIASCVDGYIVIMPMIGDCVIGYDIETNTLNKWPIEKIEIPYGVSVKFRSAFVVNNSTWILPQGANGIIEFNHITKQVIEYDKAFDDISGMEVHAGAFFGKGCMKDDSVWLPCLFTNGAYEYNIKQKKGIFHSIGHSDNAYEVCTFIGGKILLVDNRKQMLVCYDVCTNLIVSEIDFSCDFGVDDALKNLLNAERYKIYGMLNIDKRVLLIPLCGNSFLIFDDENGTIKEYDKKLEGEMYMSYVALADNQYIICTQTSNKPILFSVKNGIEQKEVFTKANYKYLDTICETNMMLEDFIDAIVHKNNS